MFVVAAKSKMMNNDMDLSYFSQGPFLQLYGFKLNPSSFKQWTEDMC